MKKTVKRVPLIARVSLLTALTLLLTFVSRLSRVSATIGNYIAPSIAELLPRSDPATEGRDSSISAAGGWPSSQATASIRFAASTGSQMKMKNGVDLPATYEGPAALQRLMASGQVQGKSLASADFDEDGQPDLIRGYAAAGGGIIAIQRGNVDFLFPNQAKLGGGSSVAQTAPFFPETGLYQLPESPDFIGVGDFDNDGHIDVVAAAAGSDQLLLLPGDGHGGFGPVELISLPGTVTTMTAGEIDRPDGLADIAVGVITPSGPRILVYESPEGALITRQKLKARITAAAAAKPGTEGSDPQTGGRKISTRPVLTVVPSDTAPAYPTSPYYSFEDTPAAPEPEVIAMPAPVTSILAAPVLGPGLTDLVAAAGSNLVIVHGRDRKLSLDKAKQAEVPKLKVDRLPMNFYIESVEVGDFIPDRDNLNEIAMLSDSGDVHLLARKDRVLAPWSQTQVEARKARLISLRQFEARVRKDSGSDLADKRRATQIIREERKQVYADLKHQGLIAAASGAKIRWELADTLPAAASPTFGTGSAKFGPGLSGQLVRARVSGQSADDLLVVDPDARQIHVIGQS
ncbi:MAG: FG-GAP repeat domain-containing protein, partial [Blastocatellia bacterium]